MSPISTTDEVTNVGACRRIEDTTGIHEDLLAMVKKWKLRCYRHSRDPLAWKSHSASDSERKKKDGEDRIRDGNTTLRYGRNLRGHYGVTDQALLAEPT